MFDVTAIVFANHGTAVLRNKIVFQRNEKPAVARISLAAGSPLQLLSNARIKHFSTNYGQAAQFSNAWAKLNVGTASRHVG